MSGLFDAIQRFLPSWAEDILEQAIVVLICVAVFVAVCMGLGAVQNRADRLAASRRASCVSGGGVEVVTTENKYACAQIILR